MKTRFYLNGKKITCKALVEMIGKERVAKYVKEAKKGFREDPLEQQSWFIGSGILSIEFE